MKPISYVESDGTVVVSLAEIRSIHRRHGALLAALEKIAGYAAGRAGVTERRVEGIARRALDADARMVKR